MLYAYCVEEAFSHPRVGSRATRHTVQRTVAASSLRQQGRQGAHEVGGGLRNTSASAYVQSEILI